MLLYYDHQQTMTGFNRLLTRISLMRMIQSHLTMSSNFVKKSSYRSVNEYAAFQWLLSRSFQNNTSGVRHFLLGRATVQAVSRRILNMEARLPTFHVGFVVNEVTLGWAFVPSLCFPPCQYQCINAPY